MAAKGKRRRVQEQAEIPMSSMIDVVFLLLIYFIVTQKDEIFEAHLAVNLPSPTPAEEQEEEPKRPIEITVLPGEVRLRGLRMTTERMCEFLAPRAKEDPELTVIVQTSTKALHHEVVNVLDLCRSMGLTKLSIATLND
ncbi:MAG: biopolymer transporter ExbD [Victivallales bacterium]|jgi:biopolymer transport protein ExbD|nr:biopolymer transporter ExbD [Victivallales bacterium]MBT7163861.1 biopolymer transporter ExbD [Victivallales bacterium]MBT7298696.1 biopolymer transporter ExbD [Victivallales bacterium]